MQNAYTITVNENNKITNINQADLSITISPKSNVTANTTLKLVVFDENGAQLSEGSTPLVDKIDDSGEVVLNKGMTTKNSKKVVGDASASTANKIDATNVPDGKIYFRLYAEDDDKFETPLAEQVVVKNTVEPKMAEVSAKRAGIDEATFAGTRYGESDIKTVYYCAVPMTLVNDSNTTDSKIPVEWQAADREFKITTGLTKNTNNYAPVTKRINVSGSDSIATTIKGLETNLADDAYRIYYVLENEHGSQTLRNATTGAPFIDISKDVVTTPAEKVDTKTIVLPKDTSSQNKFTWTDASGATKGYIVTLYKDGEIYYEEEVTTPELVLKNYENDDLALEAGEYYIKIVTKGDASATSPTTDSEAVVSEVVTVKPVKAVSNINYTVDTATGLPKISWKETDANCGGYTLKLYKQDKETGVTSTTEEVKFTTTSTANKSISFPTEKDGSSSKYVYSNWTDDKTGTVTLDRNNDYTIEVVANVVGSVAHPEENTIYVDSQPETYSFYAPYREVNFTTTSERPDDGIMVTDSTIRFRLSVKGTNASTSPLYTDGFGYQKDLEDYTYAIAVYDDAGKYQNTKPVKVEYTYKDKAETEIDETFFTVEGLEANTNYKFRLIAKCGDFEGWSNIIGRVHTMPRIRNLTVVADDALCTEDSKTIYVGNATYGKGSEIKIEGETYSRTKIDVNASKGEFIDLATFVSNLKEGDTISIDGNKIDIGLNENSSDATELLKAAYVKDKIVTVSTLADASSRETVHKRKLATTVANSPAEVHLKGNESYFDITGLLLAEESSLTLQDNVIVKTVANPDYDLNVKAGSDVTINGVGISTSLDTVTRVEDETTLVVVATEQANNLVFENRNDKMDSSLVKDITIKFVSADGEDAVQQGTIVINGKANSKITVTQEDVTVGSDITVTVEKGTVDIYGTNPEGATVTLSPKDGETAKITTTSATPAPAVLRGAKALEIKEYASADDLEEALNTDVSEGYEITDAILTDVNNWLKSFSINGKEATVTVDSTHLDKVTISYEGTETLQVKGLK